MVCADPAPFSAQGPALLPLVRSVDQSLRGVNFWRSVTVTTLWQRGPDGTVVDVKRLLIIGGLLGLAIVMSSAPIVQTFEAQGRGQRRGGGRGVARPRKVVLAWADTRNGIAQHDSVSHALAVIERLGYESGLYDTYIRTDSNIISKHPRMTDGKPASGGPDLTNVDAIFFLGHRDVPLDAQQKVDLL